MLYLYKFFDITDQKWVHKWSLTQPTTSPNGPTHAIDPHSFSIIDTYDPDDDLHVSGNLFVAKQTFLQDRLTVSQGKATELGGTLYVAQDAVFAAPVTMNSTLRTNGALQATKLVANTIEAFNTGSDTLTVTAKNIKLDAADVQITGTLNMLNSTSVMIRDKVVVLGAVDADNNGVTDTDDTTRDGAGLVVPGPPQYLPGSKDPNLYEHSLRWNRNSGDFTSAGAEVDVMLKPLWEFMGGGIGMTVPDTYGRKAKFFFAPSFEGGDVVVGLYYSIPDGRRKRIFAFATPEYRQYPVWRTSGLSSLVFDASATRTLVADNAVTYKLTSGSIPPNMTWNDNGSFSGYPVAVGTYSFEVTALNYEKNNEELPAKRTFSIKVAELPTWNTLTINYWWRRFTNVYIEFKAEHTTSFVATTSVPQSLVLSNLGGFPSTGTGTLSGTGTGVGRTDFTLRAISYASDIYVDRAFSMYIVQPPEWGFGTVTATGTYNIKTKDMAQSTQAYIDMDMDGGNWLLVYETTNASRVSNAIQYTIDKKAALGLTTPSRIAYRMQRGTDYAWVSFDAIPDPLGVPTGGSAGNVFVVQKTVSNLHVISNVTTVQATLGATGFLEIAPSSYSPNRTSAFAFGSDATYDTNDSGFNTSIGYGCFQVHNISSGQTVMAWNNHGSSSPDIGFGNQATGNPDWTGAGNGTGGSFKFQTFVSQAAGWPLWAASRQYDFVVGTNAIYQLEYAYTSTVSKTSGTPPAWLTIGNAGQLSGTPTAAGSTTLTFTAVSDQTPTITTDCTIVVASFMTPVWTTPAALPGVEYNGTYSLQFAATYGVTYMLAFGTLPAGLTLSESGLMSGVVTATGTYNFSIKAVGGTSAANATRAFNLTCYPFPTWTMGTSLPNNVRGDPISVQLSAQDAYSYAPASAMPSGVSVSGSGLLSGIAASQGTYTFQVTAIGGVTAARTTQTFTLQVVNTPAWSTSTQLPNALTGSAVSIQLSASDTMSYAVKVGSSLPAGVSLSSAGLLTGTPTLARTYTFTITATGALSIATADQTFTWLISTTPTWTTASALADALANTAITPISLSASNAVSYAVKPGSSLPSGISLSGPGVLTGTPTSAGTYSFTITATGTASIAVADSTFTWLIAALPAWTTAPTLPEVTEESDVYVQLSATDAVSYDWQSALPPGLSLSSSGLLTGTAPSAGTYTFTVRAYSASPSFYADQEFTLTTTMAVQ